MPSYARLPKRERDRCYQAPAACCSSTSNQCAEPGRTVSLHLTHILQSAVGFLPSHHRIGRVVNWRVRVLRFGLLPSASQFWPTQSSTSPRTLAGSLLIGQSEQPRSPNVGRACTAGSACACKSTDMSLVAPASQCTPSSMRSTNGVRMVTYATETDRSGGATRRAGVIQRSDSHVATAGSAVFATPTSDP